MNFELIFILIKSYLIEGELIKVSVPQLTQFIQKKNVFQKNIKRKMEIAKIVCVFSLF